MTKAEAIALERVMREALAVLWGRTARIGDATIVHPNYAALAELTNSYAKVVETYHKFVL